MNHKKRNVILLGAGVFLLGLAIGCGGGGGGATGSSAAGGSVGLTAATDGTLGDFPSDVILYTRNDGFNETVYQIEPDGTNNVSIASFPVNYSSYAACAANNKVAFAYRSDPFGQENGIYVNTTVDATGATTIDAGPYIFVGSIQFTPDGSKVIYVAQGASDNAGVYVANADGTGTPTRLDDADDAHLSPSGTKLVYSRFFGSSEICLRNLDGTSFARLTSNGTQEFLPQWSKDGLQIFFTTDRVGGEYGIWRMTANGTGSTAVTSSNGEFVGSPNTDASKVAFIRINNNSAQTGVYTIDTAGTNEDPLELQTDMSPVVYWTSTNGRAVAGAPGFSISHLSPRLRSLIHR